MIAEKGSRIMQIYLGETIVAGDIDIYDRVGELSSLNIYIEFDVRINK